MFVTQILDWCCRDIPKDLEQTYFGQIMWGFRGENDRQAKHMRSKRASLFLLESPRFLKIEINLMLPQL